MDNALVFEILQWSPVAQRLIRSDTVVDAGPITKFFIEFRHGPRTIIYLMELLRMGSLCPLYTPVKL